VSFWPESSARSCITVCTNHCRCNLIPASLVAGPVTPSKFRRGRKWSLHGCLVTLIYLCAFGFYLYVRIAKTLDLGSYVWYGAIVLAIEIAGATTTLIWCLNIVMDPVHEPLKMDADNPGLTLVSHVSLPSVYVYVVDAYFVPEAVPRAALDASTKA